MVGADTSPRPLRLASLALVALLAFLAVTAKDAAAADLGQALMAEKRWGEAAKYYKNKAQKNASDADSRLNLGVCLLRLGDFPGADAALTDAVSANPTFAESVARAWKTEGEKSVKDGKLERALALYAKAVALTPSEAPALGSALIEAAGGIEDETARARVVSRAAKWAGPELAAEYTASYFRAKLGPARIAGLDEPGWAKLGAARPGDIIYYLSAEPIRQKDAGAIRILPAAVELPVKLVLEAKDTQGREMTEIWMGRHDKPAKVYYWLIPGAR